MIRLIVAVIALIALTACSGGDDPPRPALFPAETSQAPASGVPLEGDAEPTADASTFVFYDRSMILAHLGAKGERIVTRDGVECEVSVVLTDATEVALYADAGDVVATNPDRTAGVKITSSEKQTCHDEVTSRLRDFPPAH